MSLLDAYEPVASRTLPVILLLDTSGSMQEDDKIDVLNDSVTEMIEELTEVDAGHGYITLSIITFGGDSAKRVTNDVPVADIEYAPLKARGRTPLGSALRIARELIEEFPSRSFLPTVALVSDGIPTDPSWEPELDQLLASKRGQKASRFALAIGADADRELLARFSNGAVHEASEATEIRKFLQFVTMTITQATRSVFAPDVPAEVDSQQSILRLQDDDAF
ncbi:VWA domain-containing protein [Mycolicibacterium sp. HK-90]|uniref:vWA domain-containing protein n=1 Tax=Mycolicibacterium sp. HK-90 TaxID=3056937 RepID=UPI002658465E|nr:VWA domain-containing protein [Mycolicibacterium sp. HK-90]WKG04642.1 VWA domain-containing protein [Mycolicibacterium sp. HK-90]